VNISLVSFLGTRSIPRTCARGGGTLGLAIRMMLEVERPLLSFGFSNNNLQKVLSCVRHVRTSVLIH
jgi:hypothetical protein